MQLPQPNYSEEQQRAIQSEEEHLTLIASAGSGKTTVLVETYLLAVTNQGVPPDQILAITFTAKAAAEMKTRIVRKLRQAGKEKEAQIAETGPIQTIHSFCDRLLRENSLEAGIDSEFGLIDQKEFDDKLERFLALAIENLSSKSIEVRELIASFTRTQSYQDFFSLHNELVREVKHVLDKVRSAGWTPERLLFEYGASTRTLDTWFHKVLDQQPEDIRQDLLTFKGPGGFEQIEERRRRQGLPRFSKSVKDSTTQTEVNGAQSTSAICLLVHFVWTKLLEDFSKDQLFDFAELEARTVQLLESNPRVRKRLQKQYKLLMVDEAQDVNPVQYRLLDQLAIGQTRVIGDPQQSIYRFRHADRSLFVQRSEERANLSLSKNYRSEESILRFVDHTFSHFWPKTYRPMVESKEPMNFDEASRSFFDNVEIWQEAPRSGTAQIAAWIHELIQEGKEPGGIAVLSQTHWASNKLSDDLKKWGIQTRIVGASERFYARLEVRDLSNALTALTQPHDRNALLALLLSPYVGLSLDAVVLLSDEPNIRDSLRTFKSPVEQDEAKIEEFFRWFDPLAGLADRVPAWELIAELVAQTDAWPTILETPNGRQSVANVRKLLAIASESPKLAAGEFARKLRRVRELRHREAEAPVVDHSASAVTLMTPFAAKGLEFPVVVVNALTPPNDRSRSRFLVNPQLGMIVDTHSANSTGYASWLLTREQEEVFHELERLFYVAMTRAKKRLCIVQPSKAKEPLAPVIDKLYLKSTTASPVVRIRKPKPAEPAVD